MNEIVMIRTERLFPHPDSPRKDLGDLSELTESIRKNGIMQNLTVVRGHWISPKEFDSDNAYTVVIGHRRCAAAKAAGLEELPCVIRELDERQQFTVMLEENMQRQDLTIPEQAWGFQLMFDWGNSVEEIAKKTGFSEQTVKHRLEIAKLDKKTLNEKDGQMSMKDFIMLEKVRDPKARNEIFKNSSGPIDLENRINRHLNEVRQKENNKQLKEFFKGKGIPEAPETLKNNRRSNRYDRVAAIQLVKKDCLGEGEQALAKVKKGKKVWWFEGYGYIYVYTLAEKKARSEEETDMDRIRRKADDDLPGQMKIEDLLRRQV
jgi:ParB family chromosome partitioning protein